MRADQSGRGQAAGKIALMLALAAAGALSACGRPASAPPAKALPQLSAEGPTDRALGRHLVIVGGCNDCHTAGYMQGAVPEQAWLTGNSVGFKGPWGVTFASNLRLTAQALDETTFVEMLTVRNGAPPMPWSSVHGMTDGEKRALYRYLHDLGPAGKPAPPATAPGEPVSYPYISMVPQVD